mgnify:CR=1 FL=1
MTRFALVTVVALLLTTSAAPAWNKAGHMAVSAIAYEVLREEAPAAFARTLSLLKSHPSYDKLWKAELATVDAKDRDLYLFMLAGKWADEIRQNKDFDRPQWHYVNYPFKPDGQPASVTTVPPEPENNLPNAYEFNLTRLKTAPDAVEKSVAVTWLFHLVGDVHQPLHTSTLFTTEWPKGDRGGTRFYVKPTADAKTKNLHAVWDDLLLDSEKFDEVKKVAEELRGRKEFAKAELKEVGTLKFETWVKDESLPLAIKVGYRDGKLPGSNAEFTAPVLPDDYLKEAKPVADRRAVLAGYRLAGVLKSVLDQKFVIVEH